MLTIYKLHHLNLSIIIVALLKSIKIYFFEYIKQVLAKLIQLNII